MDNIYYRVWAELIQRNAELHPREMDWKTNMFILVTSINAINMWIVCIWLKYFKILDIPPLNIHLFPGRMLDSALEFIIEFGSPFIILNYFLIFHNNRYEKIVKRYKDVEFKYAPIYLFSMPIIGLVTIFVYGILTPQG